VFLALGSISNQIAVSVDGMEWEYVTITGANMGQTSYAHWNGNMWSIFTNNNSSSIYYTTNILGNGGWQLIQTNAPYTNVAITPRAIYAQSQTPGIFMKYTPNMELVDLSYNLPTITSEIQSCCYDGSNVLIGCSDGSVGMFDDVSYTTIKNGMTTPIHLSYNNRFVIIGEKDGVIWYGQTPNYNTGYNLPLTTINKVKSNSKYGYVYTPNTIYYNTGDQIHIVSPKYLTVPNTTINAQLMSIHM
jgi:hypothetical protein